MMSTLEILRNTKVALSTGGVKTNFAGQYQNISGEELLAMLMMPSIGHKDGSHFLRTSLKIDSNGKCLPRRNDNTESLASFLVLDCDSHINTKGEILEGAPSPHEISKILRANNIAYALYGSFSHYISNKGNRYRIIMATQSPYTKKQLTPTVETIVSLINASLDDKLLANVTENNTWAQPWYFPRKPSDTAIEILYLQYLEGEALGTCDSQVSQSIKKVKLINLSLSNTGNNFSSSFNHSNDLSPIHAFNQQYPLPSLLAYYGYKKIYVTTNSEKWISPHSTSGEPGITVWENNKFFSHHNDDFNDGKTHDSFDLMRIKESLSYRDAVIKAAKVTKAPGGLSVDAYNKT